VLPKPLWKEIVSRFRITAILLLIFLGVPSASANTLVSTNPISGSTLSVSPTNVTITGQVTLLADAPDASSITVTDPNGARVDDGTITIADMSAIVGVKPLTETGMYTVTYSLASEGEIPLEGSFTFKYQAPSVISTANPTPEPSQTQSPASSSWGTNFFVIVLLIFAVLVTVGLSLYARKLFANR
jgi:methionine-rich copper-binding protein CopC